MDESAAKGLACWALIAGDVVHPEGEAWVRDPEVLDAVADVERKVIERMVVAEYGVGTSAKAVAADMLKIVAGVARRGKSEAVRHKAAMDVLALAGHVPVKKIEVSTDRMLEQMTAEELRAFAELGIWPERLMGRGPGGTEQ